jgi:hypothetical protein
MRAAASAAGGALVALRSKFMAMRRTRDDMRRLGVTRISSHVLSRGCSVHVVRWNGEDLMLGCTDASVVVLAKRDSLHVSGTSQS